MQITLTKEQKEYVWINEKDEPVCYLMDDGSYISKLVNELINDGMICALEEKIKLAVLKDSGNLNSTVCPDNLDCGPCPIYQRFKIRQNVVEMEKVEESSKTFYKMKA